LVQTPDQVIKDACVIENNYIVEYEHFSQGKIKGINCPFQLGETHSRIIGGAPEYSQHTEEILLGLGYTWEDIGGLKDGKVIP
jgi:crotonobetainyl-CoA:carnitine CoA-transferase CaiB-like acyl-CoA transferase